MDDSTIRFAVEMIILGVTAYAGITKLFKDQGKELGERMDRMGDQLSEKIDGVKNELTSHRLSTATDINALRADVVGIRTTLVGVDGQNGVRSEVRELKREMHQIHDAVVHIDNRVSVLESKDGD